MRTYKATAEDWIIFVSLIIAMTIGMWFLGLITNIISLIDIGTTILNSSPFWLILWIKGVVVFSISMMIIVIIILIIFCIEWTLHLMGKK